MLQPSTTRPVELLQLYEALLDAHMEELRQGHADRALEIQDFASKLFVHPRHLSNTIQDVLGQSPCSVYENKLLSLAREMIRESSLSIAEIARRLTYDPSNFNKFFKAYTGMTPGAYRRQHASF